MGMDTLHCILETALDAGASDVHLTSGEDLRIRVDGRLRRVKNSAISGAENFFALFEPYLSAAKCADWKNHSEIDTAFEPNGAGHTHRFRLNGYWAGAVPAAAVRLIPKKIPEPEACGFPKILLSLAEKTNGLILISGASGSGKSTTMASLVQWRAAQAPVHVITLEDPVEYIYASCESLIHQREVGRDVASFASGVRSALREDPDIICIGELRDAPTIEAALAASETGHLVIATLHAPDAPRAVDRLVDVFPETGQALVRSLLASNLKAVCAQCLVPSAGGRCAAFELMTATSAVQNAIREGKTSQLKSAIQTGARDHMQSFESSLAKLAGDGEISVAQGQLYAPDPDEFLRLAGHERDIR